MRCAIQTISVAVLIILGLPPQRTPAQQYRIDRWTTENGLPQNTVNAIVQTRDGYLWLGTWNGLARFDGVRFTVFTPQNTPGMASGRIRTLLEDGSGTLWMGSEEGTVTEYREGVFRSWTSKDGLSGGQVEAIALRGAAASGSAHTMGSFFFTRGR